MKRSLLILALALLGASCSDEDMKKWEQMNEGRIEAAPNEDPNLPQAKGDIEGVKESLRSLNDKTHKAIDSVLQEKKP